jgi:hypothetical protein
VTHSIENLDVYRKSVITGANLCRSAAQAAEKGSATLGEHLEERAVELVTNLADGLGFWERDIKREHFCAAKRAVLEALPLIEVMAGLRLMTADRQTKLAEELRDLAKMVSGLLRGTRKRDKPVDNNGREAEKTGEKSIVYH